MQQDWKSFSSIHRILVVIKKVLIAVAIGEKIGLNDVEIK
jgi:hypothetical protein